MANNVGKSDSAGRWQRWSVRLGRIFFSNWVSSAGTMLAIVAVILLVLAFLVNVETTIVGRDTNPYFGLVSFMILPSLLVIGLILIVIGVAIRRRRERKGGPTPTALQTGGPVLVRKAAIYGSLTLLALILLTSFSYEAYHFTDSVEFCGKVCHKVMAPEMIAYERSPHAHVTCVSCHIGPGASWFVRSKMSGVRQVFATLRNTYTRPIPTPVHNLRPARETCEVCHWPAKFHGSQLVVREHFEPDRDNTPSVSALVMKIGGMLPADQPAVGIHWHVDPRNQVRYRALDEDYQDIVEVVQSTPEGEIRYLREGADSDDGTGTWRIMDCIDCHNRPTHIYEKPGEALDEAFATGLLPTEVPFLRAEAEQVLRAIKPDSDTTAKLAGALETIYAEKHPEDLPRLRQNLEAAADVLAEILTRNVFPGMDIEWGTYSSNIAHFDETGDFAETGCFRCHDEEHISEDGRVISQDCDGCHVLLAEREDLDSLPEFVTDFLSKGR